MACEAVTAEAWPEPHFDPHTRRRLNDETPASGKRRGPERWHSFGSERASDACVPALRFSAILLRRSSLNRAVKFRRETLQTKAALPK